MLTNKNETKMRKSRENFGTKGIDFYIENNYNIIDRGISSQIASLLNLHFLSSTSRNARQGVSQSAPPT